MALGTGQQQKKNQACEQNATYSQESYFNLVSHKAARLTVLTWGRLVWKRKSALNASGSEATPRNFKKPLTLPLSSTELALRKRGEGENSVGPCYPGWRSFLTYPGLVSETRFGVFKMARRGAGWWAKVEGIVKGEAKG